MAKARLKTSRNDSSVDGFLAGVDDPARVDDCRRVMDIMARATGEPAVMWGASIIGFGQCHLRYDSGRELDWMLTGPVRVHHVRLRAPPGAAGPARPVPHGKVLPVRETPR